MHFVWIFNGAKAAFPSAVFSTLEGAEAWIHEMKLEGTLTQYPVDIPVFDYAIQQGWFKPKHEYQFSSKFIQRFTSASQDHFHYPEP